MDKDSDNEVNDVTSVEKCNIRYTFGESELMEYTYIDKVVYGLPVDCFADDGGSYKMREHDMWFLFRNSYNSDTNDVILITLSHHPKVVESYRPCLSANDVAKILDFVASNYDLLKDLANEEITCIEFLTRLKPFEQ